MLVTSLVVETFTASWPAVIPTQILPLTTLYHVYRNSAAFILIIVIAFEVVLTGCGSVCLPLMSYTLKFLKTSREIKKESKALMRA